MSRNLFKCCVKHINVLHHICDISSRSTLPLHHVATCTEVTCNNDNNNLQACFVVCSQFIAFSITLNQVVFENTYVLSGTDVWLYSANVLLAALKLLLIGVGKLCNICVNAVNPTIGAICGWNNNIIVSNSFEVDKFDEYPKFKFHAYCELPSGFYGYHAFSSLNIKITSSHDSNKVYISVAFTD